MRQWRTHALPLLAEINDSDTLVENRANTLLVTVDSFLLRQRGQIAELAARHAIPTIAFVREFVEAGALMSYGTSLRDAYHQGGAYAGRLLKGRTQMIRASAISAICTKYPQHPANRPAPGGEVPMPACVRSERIPG